MIIMKKMRTNTICDLVPIWNKVRNGGILDEQH